MHILNRLKIVFGLITQFKRVKREQFRQCGDKVLIHDFVRIYHPENIDLGSEIYIGPRTVIFGFGGVVVRRGVVIAEGVTILSSNHNYDSEDLELLPFDDRNEARQITIGEFAWVGQNALILPGVNVARYSVVGAGSVVTKDTEEYGVYGGNPAKLIKYRTNRELGNIEATWVSRKRSNHFI